MTSKGYIVYAEKPNLLPMSKQRETWGCWLPFGFTAPEQAASVVLINGILRSYFRNGETTNHIISCESADGGGHYENLRIEPAHKHAGGIAMMTKKS